MSTSFPKTPRKKKSEMTPKELIAIAKEKARIKREKDRANKKEKEARQKARKAMLRAQKGRTRDENASCTMTGVWRIFSKYIRIRDVNDEGYGQCVTWKAHTDPSHTSWIHWKQGQAGHYWSRQIKPLLFEEKNVHLQCYVCNEIRNGEFAFYDEEIVRKYGLEEHARMMQIAKHRDRYLGEYKKVDLKILRDRFIEKLNAETDKRCWPRIEKPWL